MKTYNTWQEFMRDSNNKKLSLMDAKRKFLKEQRWRHWHYPPQVIPTLPAVGPTGPK